MRAWAMGGASSTPSIVGTAEISRQALGRTAQLGDLYDATTDTFCSTSIFNKQLRTNSLAIIKQDKPRCNAYNIKLESLEEIRNTLNVDLQLILSILAGTVSLGGSAKYLQEKKESFKSVERALMYDIITVTQQLDISHKKIKKHLVTRKKMASAFANATHVVVGIDWGAKCVVRVTDHNHENNEKTAVGEKLLAKVEKLKSVSGEAESEFGQGEKDKWSELSLKIFGDVLPDKIPTTVDGAVELIRNMPELVEKCNDGKGIPVTFHMLPLLSQPFHEVSDREVFRICRLFEHIDELKQRASEFNCHGDDLEKVQKCIKKLTEQKDDLRCDIKESVKAIRSHKSDSQHLEKICENHENEVNIAFRPLEEMKRQNMKKGASQHSLFHLSVGVSEYTFQMNLQQDRAQESAKEAAGVSPSFPLPFSSSLPDLASFLSQRISAPLTS